LHVVPSGAGGVMPGLELLIGLTLGVAAPFILIATSGPLVQRWFSWTTHPQAHDPYFLYAAGNIGSAAGLLAYPFLLEPRLSIDDQSLLWAAGYLLAVLMLAACALVVFKHRAISATADRHLEAPARQSEEPNPHVGVRRAARWILLAFIPSSLMLSVTTMLSTDIAAVPLLWIAPLGLYLLTFTVAFSKYGERSLQLARLATPLVLLAALTFRPPGTPVMLAMSIQLVLVIVGGTLAHGMLAADRPATYDLTRFYLLVAVGGALGGLFNSLLAPLLFPTTLEYGVTVLLVLGLVIRWRVPVAGAETWPPLVRVPISLLIALLPFVLFVLFSTTVSDASFLVKAGFGVLVAVPLMTRVRFSGALGLSLAVLALLPQVMPLLTSEYVERTFFGVHRIVADGETKQLIHGTTVHGTQDFSSDAARRRAISYYHPDEPFGDVMRIVGERSDIGVLGLGAGGIAAYGREGQTLVFHEIDAAVVDIAWTSFTYLDETEADVEVILGDGRLTLDGVNGRYGLLVMDAFTSDAVPVHLLTLEAMSSYLDSIQEDGLIAVNISNRYLDLAPVLSAIRAELGMDGVMAAGDGEPEGATPSRWLVLARDPNTLAPLREAGWSEIPERQVLWTDQRSSLWQVVIR
jgi:hypothetical protein